MPPKINHAQHASIRAAINTGATYIQIQSSLQVGSATIAAARICECKDWNNTTWESYLNNQLPFTSASKIQKVKASTKVPSLANPPCDHSSPDREDDTVFLIAPCWVWNKLPKWAKLRIKLG